MSDSPPSAPANEWLTVRAGVTMQLILLLASALAVAVYLNSETMLNMIIGGILVRSGTAIDYWLGSSNGSREKHATIAQQAAAKQ